MLLLQNTIKITNADALELVASHKVREVRVEVLGEHGITFVRVDPSDRLSLMASLNNFGLRCQISSDTILKSKIIYVRHA